MDNLPPFSSNLGLPFVEVLVVVEAGAAQVAENFLRLRNTSRVGDATVLFSPARSRPKHW